MKGIKRELPRRYQKEGSWRRGGETIISTIVSEDEDFDGIEGIERLNASQFIEKFAS